MTNDPAVQPMELAPLSAESVAALVRRQAACGELSQLAALLFAEPVFA